MKFIIGCVIPIQLRVCVRVNLNPAYAQRKKVVNYHNRIYSFFASYRNLSGFSRSQQLLARLAEIPPYHVCLYSLQ